MKKQLRDASRLTLAPLRLLVGKTGGYLHMASRPSEPGSPPGLINVRPGAAPTSLQVLAYGPEEFVEQSVDRMADIAPLLGRMPVLWVNVEGFSSAETIRELGRIFDLHELVLEDVTNLHQRPKSERYGDSHFVVARMAMLEEQLHSEQVSIYFDQTVLLTFQEGLRGDVFEPLRRRIREGEPRLRSTGADFLAYALLDAVIDGYFPVLERIGELLEELEAQVLRDPTPEMVGRIHEVKRALLMLRRSVWPQREAIAALMRQDSNAIQRQTQTYLMDCYDHAMQIIDLIETYREISGSLVDIYLSSVSNRMNEVMKVLTIIATIFIPLSFIAGVYGMNFDPDTSPLNMPELRWYYGYPFALAVMAAVALVLITYVWRKGWFSARP